MTTSLFLTLLWQVVAIVATPLLVVGGVTYAVERCRTRAVVLVVDDAGESHVLDYSCGWNDEVTQS